MIDPTVAIWCSFKTICHAFFTGPNTPTSSGWRRWVVCGGRQNKCTLLLRANSTRRILIWEWWPSKKRITGTVDVRCWTDGRNSFSNHCRKLADSIHPLSETEYMHPADPFCIHLLHKFLPLYTTYGGKCHLRTQQLKQWYNLDHCLQLFHEHLGRLILLGYFFCCCSSTKTSLIAVPNVAFQLLRG